MRPLIGVTTSELRASGLATSRRHGEPPHPEMALGMTYMRTLEAAGAMPVVLPPLGDADAYLDRLDGVVLSGGPDLDPSAYGAEERHEELGPTEPSLDAFELALLEGALERGTPILAICRGLQLYQHVPGHRQTELASKPTQEIEITPRSRLARIMGTRTVSANSFHHQAIDRVGTGLRVVARAADGTIEGVEGSGFVVGVQWHAETLPQHLRLFEALVAAASRGGLRAAA
jgi:putative glutamine amidotransferase